MKQEKLPTSYYRNTLLHDSNNNFNTSIKHYHNNNHNTHTPSYLSPRDSSSSSGSSDSEGGGGGVVFNNNNTPVFTHRRFHLFSIVAFVIVAAVLLYNYSPLQRKIQSSTDPAAVASEQLVNARMELTRDTSKLTGPAPNQRVQTFYYPWYGSPEQDGRYLHWNHEVLPNPYKPQPATAAKKYEAPEEIGANFYPLAGCYSSMNETIIHMHMQWIRQAGIGSLIVSWYPPAYSDGQLEDTPGFSDKAMHRLLDIAYQYELTVALHVEPYKNRDAISVSADIKYCIEKYGSHPAFYRHPGTGLPLFYIYDSYLTSADKWEKVLNTKYSGSPFNIRETPYNAVVIGLLVERSHLANLVTGGFDGAFTYFATDRFTYGSTISHWPEIAQWAEKHNKMFIPSVGPGYIDTRIRPWNSVNTRNREEGAYYDREMEAAFSLSHPIGLLSITSWNEWHEGTQIEPAVPYKSSTFTYEDYEPRDPFYYIKRTRYWVDRFALLWQ
eukprot:TRINITY_DN5937_c2_g1_i2.p1 TRINITY_DN5937_c2_g1~~TRINITY_DN5937_c2_g1_i2.p1  ORF type:complete len:496 (-),score=78.63 TRINITY_DN5937_c2_g1_i2:112-1599(-)